jgi:hypothetical protein
MDKATIKRRKHWRWLCRFFGYHVYQTATIPWTCEGCGKVFSGFNR